MANKYAIPDEIITGVSRPNNVKSNDLEQAIRSSVKKRSYGLDYLQESNTNLINANLYERAGSDFLEFALELPSFEEYKPKSIVYTWLTQKWIGHVTEIRSATFTARLQDLTDGGTDEETEFEVSDIPEEDRSLLKLGAAFYWNVGKVNYNGQYKNESFLRFQRVIDWTENDMDKAADRAEFLSQNLEFE